MKKIILFIALIAIQGCNDDLSDVKQFVESVKVMRGIKIEPVPEPSEFQHFEYSATFIRSPFDTPQQELTVDIISQSRDCLQPDVSRAKTALEAYGLDNLEMLGSLGLKGNLWALVKTLNGDVHKVRKGHYIGLFRGRITQVSEQQIEILEVVPDGAGCWVERNNSIALISSEN